MLEGQNRLALLWCNETIFWRRFWWMAFWRYGKASYCENPEVLLQIERREFLKNWLGFFQIIRNVVSELSKSISWSKSCIAHFNICCTQIKVKIWQEDSWKFNLNLKFSMAIVGINKKFIESKFSIFFSKKFPKSSETNFLGN